MTTALVVDDEAALRYTLRAILEDEGLEVVEAADGAAALAILSAGTPRIDLVLTDLRMPGLDGLGLLDALRDLPRRPAAILITAHGSERVAVEAMKRGALDYFKKPFDPDEVARVVRRVVEADRLAEENRRLRAEVALGRTMVFASDAMRRVAELVDRLAGRDVTVLIAGESGTGKELVARALVRGSARAARPYLRFNCAALRPELAEAELFGHARGAFTGAVKARPGLFREADGGTLLLDEIAELDPSTQGALLRVLQEREVRPVGEERPVSVNVRILAATHRDLGALAREGRFRHDLYYRLNVVTLHVPPLRDRPEDVPLLAEHFCRRAADRFGLGDLRPSPRLVAHLQAQPWPGNVRELEHTLERLVALSSGESDVLDDLPGAEGSAAERDADAGLTLRARVAAFERGVIAEALSAEGQNHSAAARRLGLSRVTLLDKMQKLGLR